jgi:photosystem II stability/assembly factor-like uncharacterized protein
MKLFNFLLAFLFISAAAIAQPWTAKLPQKKAEDYTLFDYQKAFYDYWEPFNLKNGRYIDENGQSRKASGWKQFKRWEWDMETQVNSQTGEFPRRSAFQVYREWLKNNPNAKNQTANWQSLGPNSSGGGYAGVGRINAVSFHPEDLNSYWIGAPAGGLWHTADNGDSWTCLTDGNAVLGVSDIIIPSDYGTSNTIYIATGDRNGWDTRSIGVLKSTDSGNSWQTTDLNFNLSDNRMVTRLLLNPEDDQTIIAATSVGVFKTQDGGNDWSVKLSELSFIDMEHKPGDYNTLYGSSKDGAIYTSPDAGTTWTEVLSINAGRIELAVSTADSSVVYAVAGANDNGLYGVYKSIDSGQSFEQIFDGNTKNLLGWSSVGDDAGGQAWYDLSIAASPVNADIVLVGGVNTWRSLNGGESWSLVNHWWGDNAQDVHADKHMLKFRDNGDLFECNDGGIYYSENLGNSGSWVDRTNGMTISQIYRLGVSQSFPGEVITGLQDNGSKVLYESVWYDVKGGDGMECIIDYTDNTIQYATSYYGQITRTLNHWTSTKNIQPDEAGDGAWVTPYIMHPNNNDTLYAGYADIWRTTDQGDNWLRLSNIDSNHKFRSLAISPSNPDVIYAADPYEIWKTENGGGSWTNISDGLPSENITYVAVKARDPQKLWVTLGGYNADAVYESSDGGLSWTNISNGLPEIPANSIAYNSQEYKTEHLYLATEMGVYFKQDDAPWELYNDGLPNVKIAEIEIFYDEEAPENSKLIAASYGRGLWETDLVALTSDASDLTDETSLRIFPNPSSGIVNIDNPDYQSVNLRVTDIAGKLILKKQIQKGSNQMDLSHYDAGVYIVDFLIGNKQYSKRIILK